MATKCSIFFYDGYVDIAPTIVNLSKFLDQHGYVVTIFATHNDVHQPNKIGNKGSILYFRKNFKIIHYLYDLKLIHLARALELLFFGIQCFIWILQNGNFYNEKTINVVVDFQGLLIGLLCKLFFRQNFVFLSLEIQERLTQPIARQLIKIIGKFTYQQAEFVVIQDEDRFQTLSDFYCYKHPNVFYLPNSPSTDDCLPAQAENFFRRKFNLSQETFPTIVLQVGMLNDYTNSRKLAKTFAAIDNGCALIFHGASLGGSQEMELHKRRFQPLNSSNLFLSMQPVPHEQVDQIYASATIGLALYAANQGDNFTKIAKASGKLAYFLKHGKPVLLSNFPSLVQLNQQYQFGIVIEDVSNSLEIQSAISKIVMSYETYSKNARACFEAEFDFAENMKPIAVAMEFYQKDRDSISKPRLVLNQIKKALSDKLAAI